MYKNIQGMLKLSSLYNNNDRTFLTVQYHCVHAIGSVSYMIFIGNFFKKTKKKTSVD